MLKEIQWKYFFSDCAKYVIGEDLDFKINGDKGVATATANVLSSSKKLYEALCSEETELDEIKNILIEKKLASKKFLDQTGLAWPF
mgnify:CR=1 FL=1|tara:strand:- start:378 stop:635 length:258 start_codon:yes stop_codon:yes gene_type:complete